jgi:crotonobetainyl-CoA:carnitine CoA-transferase CaiB-like acyl-CoA transferase
MTDMSDRKKTSVELNTPLAGIRVLSLGGIWAGRIASMLLADQGADVIEVNGPRVPSDWPRALLSRGKCEITLDLDTDDGRSNAQRLAADADIVIENLGVGRSERFGVDYRTLSASNPSLVYVSIPGFAAESPLGGIPGWEGAIAASLGVYTDIHALGPLLGGRPKFSALPMASAYGGVHAAIAASSAFLNRLAGGRGSFVEVPLADAVLSAMALLIMEIEGQPAYFDLPSIDKVMTSVAMPILRELEGALSQHHREAIRRYIADFAQPMFSNHLCEDGRHVFVNAMGHVHQPRACLEVLGILDEMIAEGMIVATPYAVGADNNISDGGGLSNHWKQRLRERMAARFLTYPAAEWERRLQGAGVPASVVRSADEWLDWSTAKVAGNVTDLDDPEFGLTRQAGRFVSLEGPIVRSAPLHPRSRSTGRWPERPSDLGRLAEPGKAVRFFEGKRVLDLSNVIAGPAAARIFAELGADVVRIDPSFPQAGPRMTLWFGIDVNQGKRSIVLDLKTKKGRNVLERLVRRTDILIHNYLDRSLPGIGISSEQLRAINPRLVTCQVSAWGGPEGGPLKDYPAYDPVLQAATGITARYGRPEAPVLHGMASCVDYITGFSAALGAIQATIANELGRDVRSVRTSLAMGAQLVQSPFMVRASKGRPIDQPSGQDLLGYGTHYRLYEAKDGWIQLCCRANDTKSVADFLGARDDTAEALASSIASLELSEIVGRLKSIPTAAAVRVMRLDRLREQICVAEEMQPSFSPKRSGLLMVNAPHPSGHRTSLPFPSWYRSNVHEARRLSAAVRPGSDTRAVLIELGLEQAEISELLSERAASDGWTISDGYFPLDHV